MRMFQPPWAAVSNMSRLPGCEYLRPASVEEGRMHGPVFSETTFGELTLATCVREPVRTVTHWLINRRDADCSTSVCSTQALEQSIIAPCPDLGTMLLKLRRPIE